MARNSQPTLPSATRITLACALAVALTGCSAWNLGPEPDTYLGPSRRGGPVSLTDPALRAVIPEVPGDHASEAALFPGAAMPGAGASAATMPAATEPTTSRPSTLPAPGANPATAPHPESNPSLGQGAAPQSAPPEVPQALSVQEAILTGLQNNVDLRVQRFNVPIQRTQEEIARAAFDPTITGSIQGGRSQVGTQTLATQPAPHIVNGARTTDSISGTIGASEFLPTGTTISGTLNSANNFYSESAESLTAGLTVTQSLLRGAGLDVNLARLREAEVATKISQYELRGVAEQQVALIEETYWKLAFAERQVLIVQNALQVAQEQLNSTNETIRVGRVAETERAAAIAQVETEREDLINAKSTLETTRLTFLQSITPASRSFWNRTVTLTTLPFIPTGTMDPVDAHAQVALRLRPEINEAKLRLQTGDLEIVRTKSGLLPRLDLFATFGKSTFASNFEQSITNLNGPGYSAVVGVQGDWEPINRAARASYRAAQLSREQLEETLDNLAQTIQLDVRTEYIEVVRTRQQIDATRATREANETSLKVEQGKFVQGRSTSLLVAEAQQTLLVSQLNEVQAVTNHLIALVELYRLEGSLLLRRGLDAPGATPAAPPPWQK